MQTSGHCHILSQNGVAVATGLPNLGTHVTWSGPSLGSFPVHIHHQHYHHHHHYLCLPNSSCLVPPGVLQWPSNDEGWDHWWYPEVGGTARHQGWVAPVPPHFLRPLKQSIWEGECNLIGGPTNRKILPHINYIVRTCSILFLQREKLESISLISEGSSGASYSTMKSILPCIYLFAIHIGICSECNKNGSGPTLHKFEKLSDVHQNTLQQSIWYD